MLAYIEEEEERNKRDFPGHVAQEVNLFVYAYVCMHACMHVCMCVYLCVCVFTRTHCTYYVCVFSIVRMRVHTPTYNVEEQGLRRTKRDLWQEMGILVWLYICMYMSAVRICLFIY